LRLNTENVPALEKDISPLTVLEMDMSDEEQIDAWLEIHNDAFERRWTRIQFDQKVVNHPLIDTKITYFVMDGDNPVASTSSGVWRKYPTVGLGHYAAVRNKYQGLGLGKYLFIYRTQKMKDMGFKFIDNQTNLSHRKSLLVHFDVGYELKDGPDPWNTQDFFPSFIRRIANSRAKKIYAEWQDHRAKMSLISANGKRHTG
jgi:GNAT superfamily N-acetyltransferase